MKKYILLLLLVFVFFKLKADTELLIKDPLDYLHHKKTDWALVIEQKHLMMPYVVVS